MSTTKIDLYVNKNTQFDVKISKGMWDDERIVDLPLPEIWMSGGDACQYTITGPETALEFFDLAQTEKSSSPIPCIGDPQKNAAQSYLYPHKTRVLTTRARSNTRLR